MANKRLRGGTFNLRYGRPNKVVKGEIERVLDKHDLDFLCVQEANGYTTILNKINGYEYYAGRGKRGSSESGILVRDGFGSKPAYGQFGDGWRVGRKRLAARPFPRVTVAGWLRVASIHAPTDIKFGGKISGPKEKVDDYMALIRRVILFFGVPNRAAVVAGDWNEPPSTKGAWSPAWVADKVNAKIRVANSNAGHGRIDYALYKNCSVVDISKDLNVKEGSDHELVVFDVVKN